MPYSIATTPSGIVLTLQGTVTIRHALDLAAGLQEGLETSLTVEVDTRDLEDADICILQLLLSLRKAASSLCFDDPSDAFVAAVDRCGLRRELLNT